MLANVSANGVHGALQPLSYAVCATVFALLDSGRGGVGVYNRLRLKVSATSHMIGL